MTRKITVTYELPEEICEILEGQALQAGRPFEEVVAEYVAAHKTHPPRLTSEERARHRAELDRYIGTWDSGDECSCDNDRIDRDLAHEYENPHEA